MTKLKEGDLITVAQDAANVYKKTGDIKAVIISNDNVAEELGDVRSLRGKAIYQLEHHSAHSSLERYGVNIGHFTLNGIKIESISFDNPDSILINGEIDIPDRPSATCGVMDKFFFDEGHAQSVATYLNTVELEKFKELSDLVNEGINMMETIVEKGRV